MRARFLKQNAAQDLISLYGILMIERIVGSKRNLSCFVQSSICSSSGQWSLPRVSLWMMTSVRLPQRRFEISQ